MSTKKTVVAVTRIEGRNRDGKFVIKAGEQFEVSPKELQDYGNAVRALDEAETEDRQGATASAPSVDGDAE